MSQKRRKQIRLKNFDYSQDSFYFVTICTKNKECFFGEIELGKMILNDVGKFVQKCWLEIPEHFPVVVSDEFVVMPNHVHGLINICKKMSVADTNSVMFQNPDSVGVQNFEPLRNRDFETSQNSKITQKNNKNEYQHIIPKSLGAILRGFKMAVTMWCRNNTNIHNVWQRLFYDCVVRDEQSLVRIREYMKNNPGRWELDRNNDILREHNSIK